MDGPNTDSPPERLPIWPRSCTGPGSFELMVHNNSGGGVFGNASSSPKCLFFVVLGGANPNYPIFSQPLSRQRVFFFHAYSESSAWTCASSAVRHEITPFSSLSVLQCVALLRCAAVSLALSSSKGGMCDAKKGKCDDKKKCSKKNTSFFRLFFRLVLYFRAKSTPNRRSRLLLVLVFTPRQDG